MRCNRHPYRYLLWGLLTFNFACLPVSSGEPSATPASPNAHPSASPVLSKLKALQLGDQTLQVELACRSEEHQKGLMFRQEMPENQGMLFVFAQEQILSFWMKNTYLPLSIAYIDQAGRIIDIQDMKPLDQTPHPSAKPARYALEVNQGWFVRHGIKLQQLIKLDRFCPDS